jgi:hypothetical protein
MATLFTFRLTPTARVRFISNLIKSAAVRRLSRDSTGGSLEESGSQLPLLSMRCMPVCSGGLAAEPEKYLTSNVDK